MPVNFKVLLRMVAIRPEPGMVKIILWNLPDVTYFLADCLNQSHPATLRL